MTGEPDHGRDPGFAPGQIVTVFRSRRREGSDDAYAPLADAMLAAARTVPGFVDFSTFVGADGERVSLVTFASMEAHAAWRDDYRHRSAQQQGRDELYDGYSVQVTNCIAATRWERSDGPSD